jgi:O-antigen/teichoic acid export membrane protein
MVAWAFFDKSIWALVVGGLVSSLVRLVWSHRLNDGEPNRFLWNQEVLKEMVNFGRWIFLSTALNFLANQSDRLVLGRLISFEMLGVYGIAFGLSEIPKSLLMAVCNKVLFPSYTKFAELPRHEFREKIKRGRSLILLASAVGVAVLTSFGDVLVTVMYDNRYAAAAWMLPILALGAWPITMSATIDTALFIIGDPRPVAYGCFWSAVFLFGGMLLGFHFFGVPGAIAAVPFSNVPLYLTVVYGLKHEKLACFGQDIKFTALLLGLLFVLIGSRTLAGFPLPLPK